MFENDMTRNPLATSRTRAMLSGALLAVLLAGCSGTLFEKKEIDYKSAGKLPPLEIPPDLTRPGRDDRYAVPDTVVADPYIACLDRLLDDNRLSITRE